MAMCHERTDSTAFNLPTHYLLAVLQDALLGADAALGA